MVSLRKKALILAAALAIPACSPDTASRFL